ncbi:hypothetical protein K501DRAFT_289256 [Backusella circina FSU 941]|nr:hypothetical protein K501DRAFT_289256 [Backusella circina FSU 941]
MTLREEIYRSNPNKPRGRFITRENKEKREYKEIRKKRAVTDSQESCSDEDFRESPPQPKSKLDKPVKKVCIDRVNEGSSKLPTQTRLNMPKKKMPNIYSPKRPLSKPSTSSRISSNGEQRPIVDVFSKRPFSSHKNRDHGGSSGGGGYNSISSQGSYDKYDSGLADIDDFLQELEKEAAPRPVNKLFLPKSNKSNKNKVISDLSEFPENGQRKKLFLPSKKKRDDTTEDNNNSNADDNLKLEESERSDIIKKLEKTEQKEKAIVFTCPFCLSSYDKTTRLIQKELDVMTEKDRIYKQKYNEEQKNSSFKKPDELIKREISTREKEFFCRLHELELVIKPKGEERGYLFDIDFKALRERIKKMQMELDDVIYKRIPSDYRQLVMEDYDNLGTNKARTPLMMMSRMDSLLPGYYGPRGAAVMLDVLSDIYLKSEKLTKQLSAPQMPMEYVHQVLIPETAYRLIRQDIVRRQLREHPGVPLMNANSKAKKVMRESGHFGEAMHPLTDDKEEEDTSSPSTAIQKTKHDNHNTIVLD